ncbi:MULTISPECIES: phosphatidylinositol 4-kinase [Anaeromyxobacter]|uniref:phosphatidylinositol 4-kinase n=1 Tax=Anaeromyxobacter TaxID=161492 RepID=UPI001F56F9E2|nr:MULTISPECIES: phosphatidylinositol 4-kinase [unclassified Anaeromyxobacter]
MRTVTATRYVTALREGGSLPAIVEGDDDGLYVAKFRGAGQGPKALVAEVIAGELARAAGLPVPELVRLEVGAELGRNEPDGEIRDLLKASVGANVGLDYLPGSATFDPVAGPPPSAAEASEIVFFDALVTNVDRTARNSNLLCWHRRLWLIDHGASLYFHHAWPDAPDPALTPFRAVKDHVLLQWAAELPAAGARLAARLEGGAVARAVGEVPDAWLEGEPRFASVAEHRAAYVRLLERRLAAAPLFVEEAERARALLV